MKLYQGDALNILKGLADNSVDAVMTDPPYASGGRTLKEKQIKPTKKYSDATTINYTNFLGDNKDSFSWLIWSQLWLTEAYRILKPGGYLLVFSDWRQFTFTNVAIQSANFTWRGNIVWDKGRGSRAPHTGYFRHQCEYILWGTKGDCNKVEWRGPLDGCLKHPVRISDKHHVTGKPTELMRDLVKVVKPGAVILDPFMGSGTTGVAARLEGREFIGIELSHQYFEMAQNRIADTVAVLV